MTVHSAGGAGDADAPSAGVQALRLLGRVWAWLFLLTLIAFFTATTPHFFDLFNFQAMGANMAIVLVLALGQTFVIITGGIDLSVGYVMGLATVVISLVMQHMVGHPLPPMPGRRSSRVRSCGRWRSTRSACWCMWACRDGSGCACGT